MDCEYCGNVIEKPRKGKRFCSSTCRVNTHNVLKFGQVAKKLQRSFDDLKFAAIECCNSVYTDKKERGGAIEDINMELKKYVSRLDKYLIRKGYKPLK